jgi:hypothetical protein
MISELKSDGLWESIRKLGGSRSLIQAAVAYATTPGGLNWKAGDTLVCDASDECIRGGQTSAAVLRSLFRKQVAIFSVPGLHAKVIACGNRAVIGSANLSKMSTSLTEAAVVTADPVLVAGAVNFVSQLAAPGRALGDREIARLCRLPVVRTGGGLRKGPQVRVPSPQFLIITLVRTVTEAQREVGEAHRERLEKADPSLRLDWFRSPASDASVARLQPGDLVVTIDRGRGGPPTVTPPRHVMAVIVEGRSRSVFLQDTRKRTISLGQLSKKLRSAGSERRLKPASVWFIPGPVAARLTAMW